MLFKLGNVSTMMSVTSTSAAQELPKSPKAAGTTLRLYNDSDQNVFVHCQNGFTIPAQAPVSATPKNGFIVPPKLPVGVTINERDTHIAAICPDGTANLYMTVSDGM